MELGVGGGGIAFGSRESQPRPHLIRIAGTVLIRRRIDIDYFRLETMKYSPQF